MCGGYDPARFVNLPVELATNLQCSICQDIYREPVVSQRCGHSFCRLCIEKFIISTTSEKNKRNGSTGSTGSTDSSSSGCCCCPQCRLPFQRKQPQLLEFLTTLIDIDSHNNSNNTTTASSSSGNDTNKATNNSVVIIGDYQLTRNYALDSIVGELLIKCKYSGLGCPQVLPVRSMAEHYRQCLAGCCPDCGLKLYGIDGITGDHHQQQQPKQQHNCIDRLKSELTDQREYIKRLENNNNNNRQQLDPETISQFVCLTNIMSGYVGLVAVVLVALILWAIYALIYWLTGSHWLTIGIIGTVICLTIFKTLVEDNKNKPKVNGQSSASASAAAAAQGSVAKPLSAPVLTV
ncbi:uncharacterized protein LOC128962154 [Oppia nitens]|uniref:uncharacterized protein LOC128962154 n=1 Tax=Oppia nitens TaxID=1686743 RepID=UPI0023DC188A|nr:uncharacterized protein LOC128962154 [Oppia nitens]